MFTGIIEYVGTVSAVSPLGKGKSLAIRGGGLGDGMQPGDSIAVNGVCLSVTGLKGEVFEVEAVTETLAKTNLGGLAVGSPVNLERPLAASARVHGHWVLGHVDTTSSLLSVENLPESRLMRFALEDSLRPFVVPRGSVAVDGVSLTVARLDRQSFTVSVIGYTLEHTILGRIKPGWRANIETDIIGKYVAGMLEKAGLVPGSSLTEEKLRRWGYGSPS